MASPPKIETQMEVAVLDRNGNRNNSEAGNIVKRRLHLPTEEESSLHVLKNDFRNDSPLQYRRKQARNKKQSVTKIASQLVHHDDSDASSTDHAGTSNFPVAAAAAVHKNGILDVRTFNFAPFRPHIADIDEIYRDFISYKLSIPVTGAIILDESREKCLLVKGWKAGATWSFPRGKKNKDEEDHDCAVREVLEETGFDVSTYLDRDGFIEVINKQQRIRLYIIAGVKEDTLFAPLTKKEISEISWHRLDDLQPAGNVIKSRGINGLELYMVAPFLKALRVWISTHPPARRLCVQVS